MSTRFSAFLAAVLMAGGSHVALGSDTVACENNDGKLPRMIIVRVPENGGEAEYAFSNSKLDVKDSATAQRALKDTCTDFAPMAESDEGAVPDAVSDLFESESQVAVEGEEDTAWLRYRRGFYRNYGRYGFYGYRYPFYRYNYGFRYPFGRFGFYYNSYRYPYYYNYYYRYPGYRYYYYYNPYYRWYR